jgi:hypothetical protein
MAGWTEDKLPQAPRTQNIGLSEPSQPTLTASALLRQTYSLYSERFKTLFLIALPPAILAYFCGFIQRVVIGAMQTNGWISSRSFPTLWMVLTAVALLEGAIYWIASGFFFAGIATNVLQKDENLPAIYDAFRVARTRLAALVIASLATWGIFVVARTVLGFAVVTLIERLGLFNRTMVLGSAILIVLVLISGLVSRLGLAIPILIDNPNASASQALRESLRITEGWETFFMLFLIKAGAVGYAAYWLVNQALFRLYERGMPREEVRPWLASVLYICLAAMLESPLFISFSLLYENSKGKEQNALHAAR